jgi:hypothetical protein
MTVQKTKHTTTLSRTAQLMGGVSIAVLMAYGPANAQAVDITVDSGNNPGAFTAANVTGFDTVANSTQESRSDVEASIANGVLNSDIAGSGSSSVGIQSNALTATASGNVFTLDADQLGTTGDGTSGTLGALSGQFADGTVSTSITGSSLTIDGTGDADATSLAASENAISATTTGNNATVVFSDDISADLAGDLAQSGTGFITGPITLTRDDLTAQQLLSVAGGSSVVANTQSLEGGALSSSATIGSSTISVSLDTNDSANSAVSVDGNELRSTLSGNIASTGTDVTVDTAFNGSAGVFTQQQIGDGVDAALTASTTGSGLSVALENSTSSSLTVSENVLGASARGNVATLDGGGVAGNVADGTSLSITANSITSDAAGGQIDIANAGTVGFADATTPANATNFGFVAASQQSIEGAGAGSITASSDANTLAVDASGALSGSSLTIAGNTGFALASGNTGGTAIDLNATSITASAGLALDQNVTGTDVIANLGDTGAFTLSADVNGDLSNSALAVDSNLSVAEANGNTGRTLLSADADTALLSSSTLDLGSGVINTANATTSTEADFAVAANQSTGADAITATATSALDATVGDGGGDTPTGAIAGSSVSLSSNVQQATAGGNTLTNGIDLDGNIIGEANATFADGISAVTSLTSLQDNASTITGTSATTLSLTQEGFDGTTAVSGSSLDVDSNENRATASANRATSTLAVTADTAIIGADVTAASADFATATDITTVGGTNSLANVQASTGSLEVDASTTADITAGGVGATTAGLTGSSASISENITTAAGSANIGSSTIDLDAGTGTTTTAALANVQTSTTAVDADATFVAGGAAAGIRLTESIVSSTLAIDDNVIVASGMGNQGTSNLSVTANTIDRTESTATGSNALSATAPDVSADFASLNLQTQTGTIASTATAGGLIIPSNGLMSDSSATLNGNQLQSDAMSNIATNSIDLNGDSAITATTAGLGSVQTSGVGATPITVTSDSNATFGFEFTDQTVANSTISVDGNQSFDSATSNRVTNTVSLSGNSITGQAATLADVGVTLVPQVSTTALADSSLSSVQTSFATVDSGSTIAGAITTGAGAVTGTNVSISDNFARSFGMGNTGVNTLGLLADTSFSGTSALTGTQVQAGDVISSASVTGPVIVPSLETSTAAVDGNIAFSRSMGNDQTNALSIEGTSVTGVSVADDGATFAALGDVVGTSRTLDGDNVLTGFQGLVNGDVTGAATVTGSVATTGIVTDSSVSTSENIAQSNVTGNRGSNLLELAADTSVTGVSVLTSEQSGRADTGETNAITSTADLTFGIGQTGAFAPINSALNVDGNVGFSSAFGNDVTNRLDVSGTSVVGRDDVLATAGISATGVVSGTADNLLGNFQSRSRVTPADNNAVTSSADLTVILLNTATGATSNSTITASDNILDSTATSNRANNTLVLNAATALSAGGAIANQQASDSPVVSDVALRTTVGGASLGSVTGSSIALRDNTGIARAAGNDAVNVLNASAGTAITGVAGSGSSTVGTAGVLNASGTFATASNQVNSGTVTARASFGTDPATTISSLGVQTAALNSSTVDLSGNRLVADAVSNRVNNTISVSGRSPSTDVSTALTTRQIASGAVTSRVDTFNLASANGALDASSVGLSGNTFSASAGGNSAVSRLIRD